MTHRIRIEGSGLYFAAAHFATFEGDCEPLHGHNYQVTVEMAGPLTPDSWVMDFRGVRRLLAGVCKELDHKFLLQRKSRVLVIAESGESCEVSFEGRRYVMPVGDVVSLPIDNTTAERLAEWLAGRVVQALNAEESQGIVSVTVGVEEAPGQSGWFTLCVG